MESIGEESRKVSASVIRKPVFTGRKLEINETMIDFEKYKRWRWKNYHVLFREMRV
jgi:hypothetical protein